MREHAQLTKAAAAAYAGQVVLVSGAGGSIGSALCHRLLTCTPRRIVLFEMNEFALYEVERALAAPAARAGVDITAVLGSVADPRLVRRTLARWGVDIVVHAAAYKHVPLVEANPLTGMVNNVIGTQTIAEQSVQAGVQRFLLLSTDKAVRPTSIMGASKRLAEMVICNLARRDTGTSFGTVRFGNVFGSSGSVVPLFREQIAAGAPVTVTHPDVARFFLSADAATALVLEAGFRAQAGEIFVPEMGQPVRIADLAHRMIARAGDPTGMDRVVFTGLRQGEKLHEELTLTGQLTPTPHPHLFVAADPVLPAPQIAAALRMLREAILADSDDMIHVLINRWVEPPLPCAHDAVARLMS